MNVFKFGGASIQDADSIRNVREIIKNYGKKPLLIVISALGKTTNELEKLTEAYFQKTGGAEEILYNIRQHHFDIAKDLIADEKHPIYTDLHNLFVEIEWVIEEKPEESYNYLYDQIVSVGELASTHIVSAYLNASGVDNKWFDVRDVMKTDNAYREAKIIWDETIEATKRLLQPILQQQIVITQGFIGITSENFTTTLGREGSDFTAAIFASILNAEKVTVWKDVPGILSADPRLFENTTLLRELTYHEAVEMTYYGAQVIHPKTIKPLQNKHIPMHIRSFINPENEGTVIRDGVVNQEYPPVIVLKKNQYLIKLFTKDFSFIAEESLVFILQFFIMHRIKINMMQNHAISLTLCVDFNAIKLNKLLNDLQQRFRVEHISNLELLTIRHYNDDIIETLTLNRNVLLAQKNPSTVLFAME